MGDALEAVKETQQGHPNVNFSICPDVVGSTWEVCGMHLGGGKSLSRDGQLIVYIPNVQCVCVCVWGARTCVGIVEDNGRT